MCTNLNLSNNVTETPQEQPSLDTQNERPVASYFDTIRPLINTQDSLISHLFYEIDSIEQNKIRNATDSLLKNKNYITRKNINHQLDSLRHDNKLQLRRAQKAAAESPSYITDIPCSEETFYSFFHVTDVKKAYYTYSKNERLIEKLREARLKIPLNATTERTINHYFDSITNTHIAERLEKINTLLRKKDSIISNHRY